MLINLYSRAFIIPKNIYLAPMKLKSVFGTILTVIGVAGMIYAAVLYVNDTGSLRALLVYGILGFIFFISGIKLIRGLD